MTPLLRTAGLAIVLGFIGVAANGQDKDKAYKAFRDGMDARDDRGDQRWKVVADNMVKAIAEQRVESKEKVGRVAVLGRLGVRRGDEYLPHYYLGEALFNMGNCLGAVNEWAESDRQGVVRTERPDLHVRIREGFRDCESKGVLSPEKFDPLLKEASRKVAEADATVAAFDKQAQGSAETWRAEPDLRAQYERAVKDVQAAREKLKMGAQSRSQRDLGDAASTAEGARTAMGALEAGFAAAISAHATIAGQIQAVESIIAEAEGLDRAIESRRAELTPSTIGARQSGQVVVKNARERLASAGRGSGGRPLDEARAYASDAVSRFKSVIQDLDGAQRIAAERRLGTVLQAAQETFSFVGGSAAALDRRAAERVGGLPAEVSAKRQTLEKQIAAARRRFEAARKASDVSGLEAVTRTAQGIRTELDSLVASFGPPTLADRGVHPELLQATRLYVSGNYPDALTTLDRLPGDVPLQLHAHLFRAASLLALYQRSGDKDQSLQSQARAEVDHCKQLDPTFAPDARMFPPRFVAFYQGAAPAPSPPLRP